MGLEAASAMCGCGHTFSMPSDSSQKSVCPACHRQVATRLQPTLSPDQVREALSLQGKVTMCCPTCRKAYNVKTPKPGQRIMCKTCRAPLGLPGSTTDLHAEEGGTGVQSALVGEAVDSITADLIPGYILERKIATGGMGTVYLGRQESLDRSVAVKILSPELARDETYVQRFLSEARSAAKLNHENIVGAIDVGESKGSPYFVMEYIQGDTLHQIIKRDGALSERRSLEIARQIARGLRQAHQQGLIHRDIKSANIMIGMDGVAKICDFGLARDITRDTTLTQPGMVHSSPAYASPEQCRATKLDHRSDMYSLGVTLFEMLTGHLPFKSDAPSALFVAHATQTPATVKDLNPSVSAKTSQLVVRLLRKTPEGRFRDYDELISVIDQAGRTEPLVVRPSQNMVSPAATPLRPAGLRIGLAIGGAVMVALVCLLLMKGKKDPSPSESGAGSVSEKLLSETRVMEMATRGKPSGYAAVRARWKSLVDESRGTADYNLFAGALLEFEERVNQEADRAALDRTGRANSQLEKGSLAEAIMDLRTYPSGYAGTPAAARILSMVTQLEKDLELRMTEGVESCWELVTMEKFELAKAKAEQLRSLVAVNTERGLEFVEPQYQDQLKSLERKIDEEQLFFRKRQAETRAKEGLPAAPESAKLTPSPEPMTKPAPIPTPVDATKEPARPLGSPLTPAPARLPIPETSAQKEAEKGIRELFKEDYLKKLPSEKISLARKLIDLAGTTMDDPSGKYVLFREARDLAAQAGDMTLAFKVIERISGEYAVDASSMKATSLAELSRNAKSPEELKAASMAFLQVADEGLAADDFEAAIRAATSASQLARRAKDIALVGKADAKGKECAESKARFERVTKAREELSKNPEDPAANLAMGQYLCFVKGDWEAGRKLLVKGNDAVLKAIAARDMTGASETADVVTLGDAWWELAEKAPDWKEGMRKRAGTWYGEALPRLTGLQKAKVERRLVQIGSPPQQRKDTIDLLKLIDVRKDSVEGSWSFSGSELVSPMGVWCRLQVPYVPPDEYDLAVVVIRREGQSSLEVGLASGGRQFHIGLDGWKGDLAGLYNIEGKSDPTEARYQGKLLHLTVPTTIICCVRKTGVSVSVEGKTIIDWKGDLSRLSAGPTWKVPRTDTLFLGAYVTKFHIQKLTITTVSGPGRLVRE